ncbi:hypothetical protein [Maribacter stanieri]|uniref:hypothetical protein n=1 Tax=Maribacter stanieri TaxID=440514 RepID=UPI0024951769|nr:hypothetical protein [Maribacter stanieri]|tara:strand:+ start:1109 stop:2602 length:1494 start_codon:yes stop_codon:yes gene_type:complete
MKNYFFLFTLTITLFISCSDGEEPDSSTLEPTCEGTIVISGFDTGSNKLNLNWTSNGNYLEYDIEYGLKGFSLGEGTQLRVNSTSVELQNLEFNSDYDIYLRGICLEKSGSWTNVTSFKTKCDIGFYEGDIFLYNQDDVENFASMCYSGINGNLEITGFYDSESEPKISDLSSLANLQEVSGFLRIVANDDLKNLNGLEGLKKVGHLNLEENEQLESIEALSGLEVIYGEITNYTVHDFEGLFISYCPSLTTLEGLQNISSVVKITIRLNDALVDLNGLRGLISVSDNLELLRNDGLTTLYGFNQLESVGNRFTIRQLNSLISLEGLEKLERVEKLDIILNQSLKSLTAISNINSVDEFNCLQNNLENLNGINLDVINTSFNLKSQILNDLTGISGTSTNARLEIRNSINLQSLSGLESLVSAGNIKLSGNPELTELLGLEGLRAIEESLDIKYNNKLNNFCALDGLVNVGGYSGEWSVSLNLLNPSIEDIQNGNCN